MDFSSKVVVIVNPRKGVYAMPPRFWEYLEKLAEGLSFIFTALGVMIKGAIAFIKGAIAFLWFLLVAFGSIGGFLFIVSREYPDTIPVGLRDIVPEGPVAFFCLTLMFGSAIAMFSDIHRDVKKIADSGRFN